MKTWRRFLAAAAGAAAGVLHAQPQATERVLWQENFDAPGVTAEQPVDQPPLAGWRHTAGQVRVSNQRSGFGPDTMALLGRGVPHWGGRAERAFTGPMPWSQQYALTFQAFIARDLDVDGETLTTRNDYFGFAGCGSMDGPYWYGAAGSWRFDARALDGETVWVPEDQDGAVNRIVDCTIVWDVSERQCWGRLEYTDDEGARKALESPRIAIPWNRLYEIRAVCAYTNGYNVGANYGMDVDNIRLTMTETARPEAAAAGANLLFNGDFEIDVNEDGLPDGWGLQPFNVSTETMAEVQDFLAALPALDELLESDTVRAHDGWPLARRGDGGWPASMDASWYARLRREFIPQASRFGELPVPDGLDLDATTCVISSLRPHRTVASAPVPVEPGHGYRLSGWYRTSGGAFTLILPQVLDATRGGADSPLWGEHMLNCIGMGWAWVPQWRRFEVPFRTPDDCDRVSIRLWYYFGDETDGRRLWYDDLRVVADDSVVLGEISAAPAAEPEWDPEEVERGYAVFGRPAFPVADHNWLPANEQRNQPVRFALCAGEIGSAAVFVRSLDKDLRVQVKPANPLKSDTGYGIANAYGARAITLRAVENGEVPLDSKRYMVLPAYLIHSDQAPVPAGDAAQFWLTIDVPADTPAGVYRGEVTVQPLDPESKKPAGTETKLPVELTVRDMDLLAADAAFGTWYHTSPQGGPMGPAYILPGSEEIYLADQRRHGMNTVATYMMSERLSTEGKRVVTLNEMNAAMTAVQRAGLCQQQPVLIYTWQEKGAGGGFGNFGGGEETVMTIFEHGKQAGWPDILFGVLDEQGANPAVFEVLKMYERPRQLGVRTVTAGPDPARTGHLYDVWIETMSRQDWPELRELAAETGAEVWMYDCGLTGRNPLLERFYAGLWTWRTGCRGNMVWSYGWYVRINDLGLPEAKIAWEGRLAGVNDYRYLQTLEQTLAAAREAGYGETAAVREAAAFLAELRALVPLNTYAVSPQGPGIAIWNPVPELAPADYAQIPDRCARHIAALNAAVGR